MGGAVYAAPNIGVKTPADLPKPTERLVYAGISATGLDLVMLLAFEVLGADLKAVLGYEGRGPSRLAFERGESNIDYQTTPAYVASVVPLIKTGKAVPVLSFGQMSEAGALLGKSGREISRGDLTSGAWMRATGQGRGDLTLDPKFVSGWPNMNLHLKPGSPASGRGAY